MAKKILLLDTSHLLFRAFYAFPQNLLDPQKNHVNAIFGVAQMIFSLLETYHPTHIFAAQDLPKKTKRSELFEAYKGQRPDLDPNLKSQIPRIYEMLKAMNICVLSEEGYEADDVIATVSEHFRGKDEVEVCIVTGDQDAFQLIGDNVVVLRPIKTEMRRYTAGLLMAEKSLFPAQIPDFKGMAGDLSDNLKGVEGIGEKTAISLLDAYQTLEGIYEALQNGEIKGSVAKKLEAGKDAAFFTRELATLHRDVPLQYFQEDLGEVSRFALPEACAFFASIGSNSLQRRAKMIFGEQKKEKEAQTLF